MHNISTTELTWVDKLLGFLSCGLCSSCFKLGLDFVSGLACEREVLKSEPSKLTLANTGHAQRFPDNLLALDVTLLPLRFIFAHILAW